MSVGEILERDEDRPAYVRFEQRAVKDNEATLREGRYISRDEEFVLITPAYSKDCIEQKVSVWVKKLDEQVTRGRIPARHKDLWVDSLERWRKGLEPPVDGTSVKNWSTISPAQCNNLLAAGCRTVEDLAQANDEAMRRLGMGGMDLRNKAKAWLQVGKDRGPLTMEISSLQKENEILKGSIKSLQEQIKLLQIQMEGKSGERTPEPLHSNFAVANNAMYGENQPSDPEITGIIPDDIVDSYVIKFGKKPHHLMKPETILKKLRE